LSEYVVLVQAHTSTAEAASWTTQALRGVPPDDIVSITQSTSATSGPGYYDWHMTTMVVIRRRRDGSANAGESADTAIATAESRFDLVLADAGERQIQVIKLIREWTGWGLKEAKALVDAAPCGVYSGLDAATAERLRGALVEAGASVELRTSS
jgi:ribosomal protein L7/L12